MKRLLTLLSLFSFYFSYGQGISLDVSDMGSPTKIYSMRIDSTLAPSIQPGTVGGSQTWNFIALSPTEDTMPLSMVNSNTAPYFSLFPNASMCYNYFSALNYFFYEKKPEALLNWGVVSDYLSNGDTIRIAFSIPDTVLKFPAQMGTHWVSESYGDTKSICNYSIDTNYGGFPLTIIIDTLRIKHQQTRISQIESYGSMQTPMNVFDVVKQRNLIASNDTIWGYGNVPPPFQSYSGWYLLVIRVDTTVEHDWWTKSLGVPAVRMFMSKNDTAVPAIVEWVYDIYDGIDSYENNYIKVYPNPVSDKLQFSGIDNLNDIKIYDVQGRNVISINAANQNHFEVNTSRLSDGMYFYSIDASGKLLSGKFIVRH